MTRFTFSPQFVYEGTRDSSRGKRYKDGVAAQLQRTCLILLTIIVCSVFLPQADAQFVQQGSKVLATGSVGSNIYFGSVLALSSDGNTAIIGGYGDNNLAGASWIFTRVNGVWTQQGGKLFGSGAVGNAWQGQSVALSSDGNTAIVGGPSDNTYAGAVWVWTRSGGIWTQQGTKLVGTGATGAAFQGESVALSSDGNTAAVGGTGDGLTGAVWVWTRSGGVWTQQGSKLIGSGSIGDPTQGSGVALSSDGNTLIVGGRSDNSYKGAAWAWTRSGGTWSQQGGKLIGSDSVGFSQQGGTVRLSSDGNTALVGGISDNTNVGAVWVWTRSGGVWSQQGNKLVGTGVAGNNSYQGSSISLSSDGNTALIGGDIDNGGTGAIWMWSRTGGVWTQQGTKTVGTGASGSAYQGAAVAISSDGNTMIESGYYDNSGAGAFWTFSFHAEPRITSVKDIPKDQGGKVRITWNKSFNDTIGTTHLVTSYGLWRLVPPGGVAGSGPLTFSSMTASTMLGMTYDFIATIPAVRFDSYAYVAQTLSDSTLSGVQRYTFIVSAHTADATVFYISEPDSGYSVDNISPLAPASPVAQPLVNGPISLSWSPDRTDPDVGHYSVYRSTKDGFAVDPSTRLLSTRDTVVVDSTTSIGLTYYYRITTVDIHENESIPTAQLGSTALAVQLSTFTVSSVSPSAVRLSWTTATETGIYGFEVERSENNQTSYSSVPNSFISGHGTTSESHSYSFTDQKAPIGTVWYRLKVIETDGTTRTTQGVQMLVSDKEIAPLEFTLLQNYPNPFNPSTQIKFSVATTGPAKVLVYNLLGEEVTLLYDGIAEARQYYSVKFDGARLPSGMYLYRLQSGSLVETKKLMLMK